MLLEVQAVGDFSALEPGDLSFKAGEILTVLDSRLVMLIDAKLCVWYIFVFSRDDGWLIVENALGQRGLAPSNYVTVSVNVVGKFLYLLTVAIQSS